MHDRAVAVLRGHHPICVQNHRQWVLCCLPGPHVRSCVCQHHNQEVQLALAVIAGGFFWPHCFCAGAHCVGVRLLQAFLGLGLGTTATRPLPTTCCIVACASLHMARRSSSVELHCCCTGMVAGALDWVVFVLFRLMWSCHQVPTSASTSTSQRAAA